jgi:uncharacterized protein
MPNPFAHVELSTSDLAQAKKFYQSVFNWKLEDMPAHNYTMIAVGEGVGGGMQKNPNPTAPSAWLPYVQVDDVKKTLAKASKGGGQVALDYQEIGDMGAIGVLIDPSGAMLGVWQAKAPAAPAKKAASKKTAKKAAKKVAKKAASKKTAKKTGKKKASRR